MTSPRFSVGQRVRVNCLSGPSGHHGAETVVTAVGRAGFDGKHGFLGYEVDLPCVNPRYERCVYRASHLIPLYGRRPELGSWHELADIWKPEGVRC